MCRPASVHNEHVLSATFDRQLAAQLLAGAANHDLHGDHAVQAAHLADIGEFPLQARFDQRDPFNALKAGAGKLDARN